jgi:hypothetical protein
MAARLREDSQCREGTAQPAPASGSRKLDARNHHDPKTQSARFNQYLGINEVAPRSQRHCLQAVAAEDFERKVHVGDANPEDRFAKRIPRGRLDTAVTAPFKPRRSRSDGAIRVAAEHGSRGHRDVARGRRKVGIGVPDYTGRRGGKSRANGRPVAVRRRRRDHPQPRDRLRKRLGDAPGVVAAPIVHEDDLGGQALDRQTPVQDPQGPRN